MSALAFIEDLWSPPDPATKPPQRQFIAGTLGGVNDARWAFLRLYLYDGPGRDAVKARILERQAQREGTRLTFLSEFLHLGDMTKEGLIIAIAGKGGQVLSLHHSKHGERAQALTREAARDLFAKGTWVVSIDESGRRAVTTIGWNIGKQLTLSDAPAVAAPASAAPPHPREARGAAQYLQWSHALKEDAARVAKARLAILNGRWG